MTQVLRETRFDLDTLFDEERFDDGAFLETLGEFDIADAVSSSTMGSVRFNSTDDHWVAWNGVIWQTIERGELLWAIHDVMVKVAGTGMRLVQERTPYEHAEAENDRLFYTCLRKRADNLRFLRRTLSLMEESKIFRILLAEIAHSTKPEELVHPS